MKRPSNAILPALIHFDTKLEDHVINSLFRPYLEEKLNVILNEADSKILPPECRAKEIFGRLFLLQIRYYRPMIKKSTVFKFKLKYIRRAVVGDFHVLSRARAPAK